MSKQSDEDEFYRRVSTVIQFTRPKPPRPSATGSSNPTRKKEPRLPGDEAEPPGSLLKGMTSVLMRTETEVREKAAELGIELK